MGYFAPAFFDDSRLATVVIGGLLTSLPFTLYVIPVLYRWIAPKNGDSAPASAGGLAAVGEQELAVEVTSASQPQRYQIKGRGSSKHPQ